MNSYLDLVAKGLEPHVALLKVHGIVGEVHVAADVEVHPLAEPHNAVVVHLDRLGGVVKLRLPEKSTLSTISSRCQNLIVT